MHHPAFSVLGGALTRRGCGIVVVVVVTNTTARLHCYQNFEPQSQWHMYITIHVPVHYIFRAPKSMAYVYHNTCSRTLYKHLYIYFIQMLRIYIRSSIVYTYVHILYIYVVVLLRMSSLLLPFVF